MYKIIFEDNSIFKGKPEHSKWNNMPDKAIKRIEYTYKNSTVVLEGYEQYCHIVKKGSALIGNFNGIMKIILIARTKKESQLYIWDLIKGEFSTATTEIDKEYNNRKVTSWKKGISALKPTYKITKL